MKDNVVQEFIGAIQKEEPKNESIYSATVSRIDDEGVVWVYVAGANKETPTDSTSSEVKKGDVVNVMYQNNKLYILGNYSDPASGIAKVRQVEQSANTARQAANNAVADAGRARVAAEDAEATANSVRGIAVDARNSANEAKTYAQDAQTSATNAQKGLAQVESVVDTLNWLTEHSSVTTDTTPVVGKSYYIKNQDNTFTLVTDTTGKNPASEGWYVMDEAIANYVASHLALTNEGLWIIPDSDSGKVLIATGGAGKTYSEAGTYIINTVDGVDTVVAKFAKDDVILGGVRAYENKVSLTPQECMIGNKDEYILLDYANGIKWQSYFDEVFLDVSRSGLLYSPRGGMTADNFYINNGVNGLSVILGEHTIMDATDVGAYAEKFSIAIGGVYFDTLQATGYKTRAIGQYSFAQGSGVRVDGDYANGQGLGTIAEYEAQTVHGRFNDNKQSNAFEIGNGTSDTQRSNGFEVDWDGNVNIPSGAKYKINGANLSASDVGAVPTTRKVNNKALSADITLSASDVGAVPTSRTINSKALSSNITLSASDVGAQPTLVSGTNIKTINNQSLLGSGNISIPIIDNGLADPGSVAANSYGNVNVTFSKTFAGVPNVVVGFNSNSTAAAFGRCSCSVASVTKTGCVLRFFNGDTVARHPGIRWIAIGE